MTIKSLSPANYFNLLVKPHFADLIPGGNYNGTLNEFTVMDDVSSKRKIIEILGNSNILKRRDASCNITFSPVGKASIRQIDTDPIYAATETCENEFYQGCLEDFRNGDEKFENYILDFFLKAIKVDIDSNAYFGDISRADDSTGIWNWNTFDGIFKHIANYVSNGTIPANQAFAITPAGTEITPQEAYNYLENAWKNQDVFLKNMGDNMKAFYVDNAIYDAYEQYLILTGGAFNVQSYINGIPNLKFKRIAVLPEPTWNPIMSALNNGATAHAIVLTIRGNFIFATDKNYGETTPQGVQALRVWYSEDSLKWKYANFLRAGTGIAYPEHTVIGVTNF
jgi:hypothetical protein